MTTNHKSNYTSHPTCSPARPVDGDHNSETIRNTVVDKAELAELLNLYFSGKWLLRPFLGCFGVLKWEMENRLNLSNRLACYGPI